MYTGIYLCSSRRDPMALAQQQDLLVEICRKKGWGYKIFKDEANKSKALERPGLRKLLQEAEQGQVDKVLVTSFDRLAKEEDGFKAVIDKFRRHGVEVVDWYLKSPR